MKKNLIKTLLIGATIGTALTGLTSNRADACLLSHDTIADTENRARVELIIKDGEYYKKYKSKDYCYTFYDYHPLNHNNGPVKLYCTDAYGNRKTGFLKNGSQCFYFINGQAISGQRWVDGHLYNFDPYTYQGSIVR